MKALISQSWETLYKSLDKPTMRDIILKLRVKGKSGNQVGGKKAGEKSSPAQSSPGH